MEQVVVTQWLRDLIPVIYGYEACAPSHTFGPAVRPYYLLHFVLEGQGQFFRGDRVYDVNKGDIFVIRPEEVTTYRAGTEDPWQYSWIGFHCSRELPFLQTAVLRQPPVRQIFTYIRDHCQYDDLDGKIFSVCHDLVWQLSRSAQTSSAKTGSYAAYAKAYLENTYMRQVTIQELADSLHIDRRYLTLTFRKEFGMPPQAFLMQLRLEKAREFLAQGHSVTETARLSGFTDLSNFSRKFKQWYGISPGGGR